MIDQGVAPNKLLGMKYNIDDQKKTIEEALKKKYSNIKDCHQ
jgi:hypothetical protein